MMSETTQPKTAEILELKAPPAPQMQSERPKGPAEQFVDSFFILSPILSEHIIDRRALYELAKQELQLAIESVDRIVLERNKLADEKWDEAMWIRARAKKYAHPTCQRCSGEGVLGIYMKPILRQSKVARDGVVKVGSYPFVELCSCVKWSEKEYTRLHEMNISSFNACMNILSEVRMLTARVDAVAAHTPFIIFASWWRAFRRKTSSTYRANEEAQRRLYASAMRADVDQFESGIQSRTGKEEKDRQQLTHQGG